MFAGMWLLLRRRQIEPPAALFGAMAFTFCGFNLLHFVHVNAIAVVAHLPWLLYAIDRLAQRSTKARSSRHLRQSGDDRCVDGFAALARLSAVCRCIRLSPKDCTWHSGSLNPTGVNPLQRTA